MFHRATETRIRWMPTRALLLALSEQPRRLPSLPLRTRRAPQRNDSGQYPMRVGPTTVDEAHDGQGVGDPIAIRRAIPAFPGGSRARRCARGDSKTTRSVEEVTDCA